MGFRIKKTISGAKGGNVTQLAGASRVRLEKKIANLRKEIDVVQREAKFGHKFNKPASAAAAGKVFYKLLKRRNKLQKNL